MMLEETSMSLVETSTEEIIPVQRIVGSYFCRRVKIIVIMLMSIIGIACIAVVVGESFGFKDIGV